MNVNYTLRNINTTPTLHVADATVAQTLADIAATLDTDLTAIKVAQERTTELFEKIIQDPLLAQPTINVSTVAGQPLEVIGI